MNDARRSWKIERVTDGNCQECGLEVLRAYCKCIGNANNEKRPKNEFDIELDGEAQHVCEKLKQAAKKQKRKLVRIKKNGDHWIEIEEVAQQPQQENEEMRTLYNASHTDRDGRHWPIFGMTDGHMIRLLNYKAKRFDDFRERMCGAPAHSDPAIAALGKATSWKPEELVKNTMEAVDELSPFLQEALVRGGHVAQAATEAMRLITKRTARVALPDEGKPIESATEELDWDRPDDAAKLIEEID